MNIENAMVLAAGLGTRMRPITDTIPKPLVQIAGKPLIDYALDTLKEAGCKRAVVNIHYLAQQMIDHLAHYTGMEIVISDERAGLLNSGGGLAKGVRLLPTGPVFVMNADLFWVGEPAHEASNLTKLAGFFDAQKMDMAMLCVDIGQTTGHDGKIDFSMAKDGRLTRYKPGTDPGVVYAGAFIMHSALLDDAPDGPFNLNLYFDRAITAGRLYGMMLEGHWVTAGTPEAISAAEEAVRTHQVDA
ncbi:nucleotidyltransferase family protein [Rhizobium sp. KVB221]|uniref:Nucleotidyltransferase family protein n=1 Tax=Rhizobium setariae TaxID=2801340 RepID=A0A936YTL4_9HYPH|nr:nucleotidyltransferase family protein [Rhizobium setariae]MBL0374179.1 nucleotidyltransferase family protein [Rhizobium setariae]